ncbi:saxitoxin and tetrodotoxin-binding protein 1-like [Cebidichthys violaceus]|uniref:saxitoxin and tetrodotoxin-binding protein 1-like n=1 Tax=Cebidichthys violaceus TaxID=271503 RepID=UPI0035CC3842
MSQSRMSSVKTAVLLLLVAAIGTNAAPGPEDCHSLKKLPTSDLHEVYGDWVLVWSVADHQEAWDLLPNVSSSHVEIRLHQDNTTVLLKERNLYMDKLCSNYFMNFTGTDAGNHTLDITAATVEKDGVVSDLNESIQTDFYRSCSECLMMVYHSPKGRYLLNYRKEGHHQDVEKMNSHHDALRKLAECLGFPHDKPFIYDGAADFCHKKSSPEEDCHSLKKLPTSDLHEVMGDWVLVWSVADHQEGWDLLPNVSSSHVELRLLDDNTTVLFKERNMLQDKSCSNYFINMSMTDAGNHTLHNIASIVEKDGVVTHETGHTDVYRSCSECLMVTYESPKGRYLLNYRKEGHHQDVEKMNSHHDALRKLAECLGFPHDKLFIYDGAADFCHKKSSPEEDVAATEASVPS